MDLRFSAADEAFRAEARGWLTGALVGDFATVRGRGGPGDEHSLFDERLAWEQHLGAHGYVGLAWPAGRGGRDLSLHQQVIWHEEYARAQGPGRLGHIGEGLVAPTVLAYGTDEQQTRFLPGIRNGTELWCQGYSEPNAGSDLANLSTRAERDGDGWALTGQKVWTSLAHWAQWCFVLARTDRQRADVRALGLERVVVPEHTVDGRSLVALADVLVSAGGTMNREAAVLGTPVWSMFEGPLGGVDERLVQQGRMALLTDPEAIAFAPKPPGSLGDRVRRDPADLLELALPGLA